MKAGMPAGVCPEKWILEHEDVMLRLQQEYVAAGSDILYAPTFTTSRLKLREYGMEDNQKEMIRGLVAISKKAAAGNALVAGDLTMTGVQLAPIGTLDFEELVDVYKEQIRFLIQEGVDLLVVETMMSLQETRAALIAAKETCDLPVIATLTFEQDGRTLYGTDAQTAVITLQSLGADAVGANCSTGPDKMAALIREMAEVATVPIIAKPNAGMPCLMSDGTTGYSMGADEFAREMEKLVEAGASIIGGCCGTSPEYIQKTRDRLEKNGLLERGFGAQNGDGNEKKAKKIHYLTSERKTVAFSTDSPFMVIGERINPTGKKKLQAELREGSLAMVSKFATEQEEMGASILDVNMGMSGIDEKEMMLQALEEVTTVSNLPLSIDSSHVDVMEAALRRYPGRALINSVSLESKKCEPLLGIAKKYGAMVILLPLSDKGLPESFEEKVQIIEKLLEKATAHGLGIEDVVVDGLVMTVGANPEAAANTLKTFAYCKERGIATTCGLSNISFGLPERSYVNASFLTMAIQNGLTMAIANPSQRMLMSTAFAADLLLHKENADIRYIEYSNRMKELDEQAAAKAVAMPKTDPVAQNSQAIPAAQSTSKEATSTSGAVADKRVIPSDLAEIYEAVLKGRKTDIGAVTRQLVAEGVEAPRILNEALMPAIDEVGILFEKGKYFLPQLINSAEAMKMAIAVIEPLLAAERTGDALVTIVIATVKGDIHDIGKNLVALMLKNHGFHVIDLGKDVEKEVIIETAKKENASVIALSALMTTTMLQMKEVVELAKAEKLDCKVIIGGAVITADYAQEIGADGYAKDAAEAVVVLKKLLQMS